MAKAPASKTKPALAAYTLSLDKRQAKTVVTVFGAVELRMFEKGFTLKPGQLKLVSALRKQLSQQLGEEDTSLEEQLTAVLESAKQQRE